MCRSPEGACVERAKWCGTLEAADPEGLVSLMSEDALEGLDSSVDCALDELGREGLGSTLKPTQAVKKLATVAEPVDVQPLLDSRTVQSKAETTRKSEVTCDRAAMLGRLRPNGPVLLPGDPPTAAHP